MSTLRIHLLGDFQMHWDSSRQEIRVMPNVQTLLALLLIHPGQLLSRDAIIGTLWSDYTEAHAHACLNTALWRLRQTLESGRVPRGTYLHCWSNSKIGFNWESDHWLDIYEFEHKVDRIQMNSAHDLTRENANLILAILPLYRGNFMQDCHFDWVLAERERLRALYIHYLDCLMDYFVFHGEHGMAITYGRQILEVDPLREEVQRKLMRSYVQNGQRPLAIEQYEICRALLMNELGILPMYETRKLHSQILAEDSLESDEHDRPVQEDVASPSVAAAQKSADFQTIQSHTYSALQRLEQANRDLQAINQLLRGLKSRR